MNEKSMIDMGKIWQDFQDGKIHRNPGIREDVYRSWLRSKELGIDPYMEKLPEVLKELSLVRELERKKELLTVATPVMEDIYSVIKGSSSGVWLSNEKGVIIKALADPDIFEICVQRNFSVGYDWSEEAVGNNSIGTAIYLKQPVQFAHAEHYRKISHIGYCSAAPIFNPNGDMLGVLDVTGFWEGHHPHTLGMVVIGAGAIQREIKIGIANRQLVIYNKYIMEMIESFPYGIMIINSDGIITNANQNARKILNVTEDDCRKKTAAEIFDGFGVLKEVLTFGGKLDETVIYAKKNNQQLRFTATAQPIKNDKDGLGGIVVMLREIEQMRRVTSKIVGFKAKIGFEDMIGEHPFFRESIEMAKTAARSHANIIILGESGTGKELLAQSIHNESDRAGEPFVSINCGAIPRELIGSELFGYEEGAFTGAKRGGVPGKFELANNGTLFLDEIGNMPLDLQRALLRVIQEKILIRLGGQIEVPVNVRILSATNKDIYESMSEGLFREDLYFRLGVVVLTLPPLRKRKSDIRLLSNHFLRVKSANLEKQVFSIDEETMVLLEQHQWPGNIRELENVIEKAIIFSSGTELKFDKSYFISEAKQSTRQNQPAIPAVNARLSLKIREKTSIEQALRDCDGNVTQTAGVLGVSRVTLYKKMKKYGIVINKPT
jgi:transcriptional regulator of acetoin/glycerol metabolism